jgi:predicted TIM-barrel fold metal-dependent hydrolase
VLTERHSDAGVPDGGRVLDVRVALVIMMATDFVGRGMPFPAKLRPALRDLGLAGKVVLGSDFPTIPHPYAHQLHALDRLDLGDDWLRAVCWSNGLAMI